MPQTEAQKRATAKYDAKHYATISTKAQKESIQKIKEFAEKNGITASKFAFKAMMYCVENNISFKDEN